MLVSSIAFLGECSSGHERNLLFLHLPGMNEVLYDYYALCQYLGTCILQLRVDGSIMRIRDTRMFSAFQKDAEKFPLIIREHIEREETFQSLARVSGIPSSVLSVFL